MTEVIFTQNIDQMVKKKKMNKQNKPGEPKSEPPSFAGDVLHFLARCLKSFFGLFFFFPGMGIKTELKKKKKKYVGL